VNKILQFWHEMKRRNVVRRNTVYAATAFVILELVSIVEDPLRLPEWTLLFVIIILSIGFIISIVISWTYELTPDGIQKTEPPTEQKKKFESREGASSWRIATFISIAIIAGLVLLNVFNSGNKVDLEGLETTIAVMPFENLGQNDEHSLHQAIPIALIMELNKVESFVVRPRGSTVKYRGTALRSPEIGEELQVNFLVQGFLQQQDDIVLIDIMLIKAASEEVIWNQSYEMKTENIFQVRSEISKQVASSLRNNFVPEEKNLTENPDAYLAFLTGLNYYWRDITESSIRLSSDYFAKAIELDPNFTMAYAKISLTHSQMYHFHYDRSTERLHQAWDAIENAISIEPDNADILVAEGFYFYAINDYPNALLKLKQAEGLASDVVELHLNLASLYRRKMNMDKAVEYYLKAIELDPQNLLLTEELAETYLLMRKYDLAEKYYDYGISNDPSNISTYTNKLFLCYSWEQYTEKSRQILAELNKLSGEISYEDHLHFAVRVDLVEGDYESALQTLNSVDFDNIDDQFNYRPMDLYFAEIYREQFNTELAAHLYNSARLHLEQKILELPGDFRFHSSLGIAYAGLGRQAEAIEEGKKAVEMMPITKDFYKAVYCLEDLAEIYTMTEEFELAIETLDQLLSMPGFLSTNILLKDPKWKSLRNLPAFTELLENFTS
jgi:TolB-like protein/Flp pilus assembly protein TadD